MVLKPNLVDLSVDLINFHSDCPLASPAYLLQKLLDPGDLLMTNKLEIFPSINLMDPIYLVSLVFFIPSLLCLGLSFLQELDVPLYLLHF